MENIKGYAWSELHTMMFRELPIDALRINGKNSNIKILSYCSGEDYIAARGLSEYAATHDGLTIKDKDTAIIFYDDRLSYSERNRIIMHEVGHVMLGHTVHNNLLGHNRDTVVENAQEEEANQFALAFLAPAPVLLKMGVRKADEISRITGLSEKDSIFIASEVAKEKKIGFSQFSEKISEHFSDYIYEYVAEKRKRIFKYIIAVLVVAGVVASGFWYANRTPEFVQDVNGIQKNTPTTYYVTKSGDRYHEENCSYVQGKGIPISLEDAKKGRLYPLQGV